MIAFLILLSLVTVQATINGPDGEVSNTITEPTNIYNFFKVGNYFFLVAGSRLDQLHDSQNIKLSLINPQGGITTIPEYIREDNNGMMLIRANFTKNEFYEKYGCISRLDSSISRCKVQISRPNSKRNLEDNQSIIMQEFDPDFSIYKDQSCTIKLKKDDSISYASTICIILSSNNAFVRTFFFETTELYLAYRDAQYANVLLDLMSISTIDDKQGQSKAAFRLVITGSANIIYSVKLKANSRLLSDANSFDGKLYEHTSERFNVEDSFGEWKTISFITILSVLLAFI